EAILVGVAAARLVSRWLRWDNMDRASPPLAATGLMRWTPGLFVLRNYHRVWLSRDIVAGLVLTALLVPAGMGYAQASGLPPIYGLYATIAPLLTYALLGPS